MNTKMNKKYDFEILWFLLYHLKKNNVWDEPKNGASSLDLQATYMQGPGGKDQSYNLYTTWTALYRTLHLCLYSFIICFHNWFWN